MPNEFTRMRFLVVDDFNDMLRAIRQMLEAMGAQHIHLAADGAEAIKVMEKSPVDVVLCDYNLGESKDGQQILEEARIRGLLKPSSVFIMITAESSTDMVLGAMDHAPDDYLVKPFNRNALKLRIERVLRRKVELGGIEQAAADRDLATAIAHCDEKLSAGSPYRLAIVQRKAELLVAAGEYAEALALYEQVLEERHLRWAAMGRGGCLYHLGRLAEAEAVFEAIIKGNRLVMEAYDWLARVKEAQGSGEEARAVLAQATTLSPRSVRRHRELGQMALKAGDYEAASKAYHSVVRLERHSFQRSVADHTRLAQALHACGDDAGALKTLREGRRIAGAKESEQRQAGLLEGDVLEALGQKEEAEAVRNALAAEGHASALERAKMLFAQGETEEGSRLLEGLVRDNHEDETLLSAVRSVFQDAGMGVEGDAMVTATQDELINLNNEGVDLARAGRVEEAATLFRDAAEGMPANRVVNLNAAQVLVIRMRQRGVEQSLLDEAERYLARVASQAPDDAKYLAVRRKVDELAASRRSSQG